MLIDDPKADIEKYFTEDSEEAIDFRREASALLSQYLLKGYILDKERLIDDEYKDNYLKHVAAEIEEIRMSQRSAKQKVADLYATAFDYDKNSAFTKEFYLSLHSSGNIENQTVNDMLESISAIMEVGSPYYMRDIAKLIQTKLSR